MVTNSTDVLLNGVLVLCVVVLVVVLVKHFLMREKYEDEEEVKLSTCYISECQKDKELQGTIRDCQQDTVFKLNTRSDSFEDDKKSLLEHMVNVGCSTNASKYKEINNQTKKLLKKIKQSKKCNKSKPIRYFCINKSITNPGYM